MELRYNIANIAAAAKLVLDTIEVKKDTATIVGFSGDIGAGKTTLTQLIAKELGVVETVVSPTFTIAKFYQIQTAHFDTMIHIDAYRIDSLEELIPLDFAGIIAQPRTLVIVEWPERIRVSLPKTTQYFSISHAGTERIISTIL